VRTLVGAVDVRVCLQIKHWCIPPANPTHIYPLLLRTDMLGSQVVSKRMHRYASGNEYELIRTSAPSSLVKGTFLVKNSAAPVSVLVFTMELEDIGKLPRQGEFALKLLDQEGHRVDKVSNPDTSTHYITLIIFIFIDHPLLRCCYQFRWQWSGQIQSCWLWPRRSWYVPFLLPYFYFLC